MIERASFPFWRNCRLAVRGLRTIASRPGSRRGATALEFALVAPAFFALIFGIEEVGRLCWTRMTLEHAVELAARCGAVNTTTCGTTAKVQTYAASEAPGMSIPTTDFTPTTPTCGYQVAASYAFTSLIPVLVPISVTLQVQSCYP